MDPVLIERWLDGLPSKSSVDVASISVAREDVRALAAGVGFDATRTAELAILVSELATNQVRHARLGRIAMRAIERDGVAGIEIIAADRGPGIEDPIAALAGKPRTHGSLGTGLSSVMRFADEVDFDVRTTEGTCVVARRFVGAVERRRAFAILGRPHPGERQSGDDACVLRSPSGARVVLVDGLGHGYAAREASRAFVDHVRARPLDPPDRLFATAQDALQDTRGAVAAILDVDERFGTLATHMVGNVIAHVVGGRSFTGTPAVVGGSRRGSVRVANEADRLVGRGVVVAFTDGLASRARIERFDDASRAHPLIVAATLLASFGRDNDDATVVVVG